MAERHRSAAYRIAFLYSAAFAAAILLLGIAVYFAADIEFRRALDRSIADEATALLHEGGGSAGLIAEVSQRERAKAIDSFGYALFDPAGRRIAGTLDTDRPEPGFGTIVLRDPDRGEEIARARTIALADGNRLVVAADLESIEEIDATILMIFGAAFAIVVGVSIAAALALGHYLRRRLGAISSTANEIMTGKFDQRVPVGSRGDEFDEVALALNAMLDRIAGLMENLRQVSSDVAHDLRTPLMRLRNQLGLVGVVEDAAAKAIEQGDALLKLFAAILRISEVEGGTLAQGFTELDLSALADDVRDGFLPAIFDSGRTLTADIAPGVVLRGDRELLAQAIANLLDNAIVHTPSGTHIRLLLDADDARICLSVIDNGPAVPPADAARLTQRFFRSQASRSTPGNGLGLSLVAAVAAAHAGEVVVAAGPDGLRVMIALPRG